MEQDDGRSEGSISLKAILLTVLWFSVASIAFVWFLKVHFDKPELLSTAAGLLAWPFVVLVIAMPATLLIVPNFRHILQLKKTIDDAPEKLSEALNKAESLRISLQEASVKINNDINGSLGEIEARMTSFEGRMQRIVPQAQNQAAGQQLTPKERLGSHLEIASDRFYETLEAWNSDGRRKESQLAVTRGGGNRSALVATLQSRNAFDRDEARNDRIAAYLKATFDLQLSARRGGVEAADVEKLDRLKQEAMAQGATFQ